MLNKLFLQTGIATGLVGSVVHFGSHAYVNTELKIKEAFAQTREGIIADAASQLGYAKQTPTPPARSHKDMVIDAATKAGINPSLALSLMEWESGNKPSAKSPKGAIGLMQVMPFNAKRCGLEPHELWEPAKNIPCGVKILKGDLIATNFNPVEALQRYNGGEKCIGECAESLKLSKGVLRLWAKGDSK